MTRNLGVLSAKPYDVVIVGGGIYGACAAWEAALRGLSVALVDRDDFGHATSANSQKIVHGGLRYLQSFDVPRMRQSIRERRTWLRIAPHLVSPLPCLMPTSGVGTRSRAAMSLALRANDLISWDRHRGLEDVAQRIPPCRMVSREACLRMAPGLDGHGVTGGALWYDGQIYDSERLTLAFILSASKAGADVANYVEVTGFLKAGSAIAGVKATDVLTGRTLEIRSRVVLNTSGPWAERLVRPLNGRPPHRAIPFVKAVNLVTRPLGLEVALGIESRSAKRQTPGLLFITPWRNRSIIGTAYFRYDGEPERCAVTEEEIEAFLDEIKGAFPSAHLRRGDVSFVHMGLLPAAHHAATTLEKRALVLDHQRVDGLNGLISILGIKYTTARDVAEHAVELAVRQLARRTAPRGMSRTTPLEGGAMPDREAFLKAARQDRRVDLSASTTAHLVFSYGTRYLDVLAFLNEHPALGEPVTRTEPVIKAQLIHAVRREMAVTLGDVIFRRIGLGAVGHPGIEVLRQCAKLLESELGWDGARTTKEIDQVEATFTRHGARDTSGSSRRVVREEPAMSTLHGGIV